ncbi:bpl-1 [Pristionchus pacificus]|uniref:Bpl-1 n=1 Tax=Pristionchus pacificus TaxID=54126 RepID=A0A2A6B5V3_PRIPA|nr:bpl-1 [Pristionchus pacificus]|eukprot:PDM61252.1 bpl-1 [Pristionchus pacificus]
MFVFAWSLLSTYAESVRKRRLHSALCAFFASPSAGESMIVCRPAAHRLTRLLGVGFSSWGAETANGSLARVASEPALDRPSSSSSSPTVSSIYRSELMEVVALPDECISSSDWRFLPSSSHFAPSASSVFFIVATAEKGMSLTNGDCPSSSSSPLPHSSLPSPTSPSGGENKEMIELQEGEVVLESTCVRVGWNRTRPHETLYACDMDTFTSVVFAWTCGLLRATLKGREEIGRMRTVWLSPPPSSSVNNNQSNGCSVSSGSGSVRSDDGSLTPRALSPCSVSSSTRRNGMRASMEDIVPLADSRPLLEQLFIGDAANSTSFGSLLSSALKAKLGSDGALNLMGNATLPRRGLTRRSQFAMGGGGGGGPNGLPPLPARDAFLSGGSLMGCVSSSVRSLRSSRSSLRHRQSSPLAWGGAELHARFAALSPRMLRDRPHSFSFRDRTPPPSPVEFEQQPSESKEASWRQQLQAAAAAAPTERRETERRTDSQLQTIQSEERIEDLSPIEWTVVKEESSAEPLFVADIRTQSAHLPYIDDGRSALSPSITISSDLDEHSLAEGRLDALDSAGVTTEVSSEDTLNQSISSIAEEEEGEMPLDVLRSSSARRSKITPPSIKRQDTEPPAKDRRSSQLLEASPKVHSARSPRRNGPAVSPMIEALRGCSKSECSTARDKVAVDPQLQRLTTIELLQRRRHSTMMYNLEDALYNHDGSRRRSLSPMALSASLQNAAFGGGSSSSIASGATDILRGSLFDTRRRSQSRRLHSASREKGKPKMKPPCVLVYTAGVSSTYDRIHSVLSSLLPSSVYTVFNISPEAIRKHHWIDPSSACLILADTHELDDAAWKQLQEYFNKSGKMIFVCQNSLLASISSCESVKKQVTLLRMAFGEKASGSMSKDLEGFLKKTLKALAKSGEVHERYQSKDLVGGLKYSVVLSKKQDSPLLLYMESGGAHSASAVFSDATTDQLLAPGSRIVADALARIGVKIDEAVRAPSLSIGYFISDEEFLNECKSLRYGAEIGDAPKLFMRRRDLIADHPLPSPSPALLPIQVLTREEASSTCSFDTKKYYARLATRCLGRNVLFVPVTTTTIDVCRSLSDALPGYDGMCVVARQQLRGQGRGGNEFISPVGVAMFNFSYSLPASCALAKCPSFIQHVACVSLAAGVHDLSGMEDFPLQDFPLRVKWPNDFYFNRSHKIGGLLVSAKSRDDAVEFSVGIGINVSNSLPTTCLNDMLPDNSPESANFSIEEVIAMTMNKFEYFVNVYENKGQAAFLEHYYKHWLHSREEVTLGDENEKVVIRGLDKYGFLECRSRKTPSKLYSVADDGNTFDMMKGLIRMKIK